MLYRNPQYRIRTHSVRMLLQTRIPVGYTDDIPGINSSVHFFNKAQHYSFLFLHIPLQFPLLRPNTLSMNPAVSLINYPCMVCFKSTSMWCSRCQNVWYCSPEHLQSDWPRHRLECAPTASARSNMHATPQPVQPRSITVSAILFAPQEDRPRVITVNCEPPSTPIQGTCPTPLVHGYFPGGQADSVVLTQGLNGEPLRFPLHLWYSPGALAANAPINQAIVRITSGSASKPWCGPVIVLKYNGSRRQGYSDAGPNDLPALSAYFLAYK